MYWIKCLQFISIVMQPKQFFHLYHISRESSLRGKKNKTKNSKRKELDRTICIDRKFAFEALLIVLNISRWRRFYVHICALKLLRNYFFFFFTFILFVCKRRAACTLLKLRVFALVYSCCCCHFCTGKSIGKK